MSDKTEQPEPCPHCGGPAHVQRVDDDYSHGWTVECDGIACSMYAVHDTPEDAIAYWNAHRKLRWRKGPPTEPGRYDCVTHESYNGHIAIDLINGTLIGDDDHYFRPCDIAWHFPIPEPPGEG